MPLCLSNCGGGNQRLVSEGTAITQREYSEGRLGVDVKVVGSCGGEKLGSVRRRRGGMTVPLTETCQSE